MILGAAFGVLAVSAALVWAMQPPSTREAHPVALTDAPDSGALTADAAAGTTPLDQTVFAARLWNSPPPPETPVAEMAARTARQPRIKPPEHQLIGIMNEAGVLYAVLYDPSEDKLIIVADGDSIDDFTVASITPERIVLKQNDFSHTLALREERQ